MPGYTNLYGGLPLAHACPSYCIIGGVCCQSSVRLAEWCNAGVSTIPAVAYIMSTHRARLVENGLNHLGSRVIRRTSYTQRDQLPIEPNVSISLRGRMPYVYLSTNKQDKCNILKAANGISRS